MVPTGTVPTKWTPTRRASSSCSRNANHSPPPPVMLLSSNPAAEPATRCRARARRRRLAGADRALAHGGDRLRRPRPQRAAQHADTRSSFAEFQQQFGGLWQPATLGYAVEQFFENGGWQAIIVRVANGARAPTLRLPAGTRRAAPAGAPSGHARVPARLGRLRRHRRRRPGSVQPRAAAPARARLGADRRAGNHPARVGAARRRALDRTAAGPLAPGARRAARCPPSGPDRTLATTRRRAGRLRRGEQRRGRWHGSHRLRPDRR